MRRHHWCYDIVLIKLSCPHSESYDKEDVSVQSSGLLKDLSNTVVQRAVDVFEVVLVASSCVVIWFAMWTLMDMIIPFKEKYIWVTLMAGFCGSFFCIYLEKIPCILHCIQHNTTKRLVFKFVHDFLITWFQVCPTFSASYQPTKSFRNLTFHHMQQRF